MISLDYSFIYQVLLFLVLWAVLTKLLFRPYLQLLEDRERKTAGTLHESMELEREGARLKAQYQEKIASAEAAGRAAKEAVVEQARQQCERLLAQARQEAALTLEGVRRELQIQLERERGLAEAEADILAREMVSKILGRSVA